MFIPELALSNWSNLDGTEDLRCPVCDHENTHPIRTEIIDGEDNYKAWKGRGNLMSCWFMCEGGHHFSLNFGFHKGTTTCYWKHEVTDSVCLKCLVFVNIEPGAAPVCPGCGGAVALEH